MPLRRAERSGLPRSCFEPAVAAAAAQNNRIDVISPMALELAAYGNYAIGVRYRFSATDRHRIDIVNTEERRSRRRIADRTLDAPRSLVSTRLAPGQQPGGDLRAMTRDPDRVAAFPARPRRARRGARHRRRRVSSGHRFARLSKGNRFLLSHLTENLGEQGLRGRRHRSRRTALYDDQLTFSAARSTTAPSISSSCSTRWPGWKVGGRLPPHRALSTTRERGWSAIRWVATVSST